MKNVEKLYECRNCGGLAASTPPACPYCGATDGGNMLSVVDLETGERVEKQRPWHEPINLMGGSE
ncbi:hypothetical protein [Haloparvum sedimenti]|uniref:hypothetical protein n=1 Tax=Haloparvum sedimenti TaxID=1678448 RepID=UPI00071E8156|nr:hypothetical protein [Haloparvum sedimenti]